MDSSPRARMDRFVEFINSANPEIGAEVIAPEAEFFAPFGPDPLRGVGGYMHVLDMMRSAFPDIQWKMEESIAEGDSIAVRFTLTGTHRGEFLGVPATGRQVRAAAMNHYRFSEGKIVEEWGLPDLFGLMTQLRGAQRPGGAPGV